MNRHAVNRVGRRFRPGIRLSGIKIGRIPDQRIIAVAVHDRFECNWDRDAIRAEHNTGGSKINTRIAEGPAGKNEWVWHKARWRPTDKRLSSGRPHSAIVPIKNPRGIGTVESPVLGDIPGPHRLGLRVEQPAPVSHEVVV